MASKATHTVWRKSILWCRMDMHTDECSAWAYVRGPGRSCWYEAPKAWTKASP
jgi:hypothetical protein